MGQHGIHVRAKKAALSRDWLSSLVSTPSCAYQCCCAGTASAAAAGVLRHEPCPTTLSKAVRAELCPSLPTKSRLLELRRCSCVSHNPLAVATSQHIRVIHQYTSALVPYHTLAIRYQRVAASRSGGSATHTSDSSHAQAAAAVSSGADALIAQGCQAGGVVATSPGRTVLSRLCWRRPICELGMRNAHPIPRSARNGCRPTHRRPQRCALVRCLPRRRCPRPAVRAVG